jgi:ribA/ribD-fused uncharacterized protein
MEQPQRASTTSYVAFHGKAHYLSNFYPARFVIEGVAYTCVEQFMQAEKARVFNDEVSLAAILKASTPLEMKRLGRRVSPFDKELWARAVQDIVFKGLMAKFLQHPELMHRLASTKDALLVEASPRDRLWGAGLGKPGIAKYLAEGRTEFRGRNLLGKLLMKLRSGVCENVGGVSGE